ncbi:MAG TPA: pilus assembly protein PilC [Acinetobacter parvus]|uniref:pilus assembly protein PilC n=1 Tax=Acinetobacter parvus TaxID=134533 RepID=UPI002C518ACC|nr:pilus assembly protein PilC [Acinetobacter parvus]HRM14591.1 pilus assembly protein PilC [Acinetobacter parvus]
MKKLDHKKGLSATVSMLMTLVVCQSVSVQASDIDIYSNATGGKTTIMLMLDTSGSMSEPQLGGSACELASDISYTAGNEPSGTTPGYTKYFCAVDIPGSSSQQKRYDRLTRLKDAIFTLMDSNQIDSNSVAMGIGQFSSQSESDNVYTSVDGISGKIVVPAALLSTTQRTAIKTAVANLQGGGATPTANAYAEVAAYMLGETTATGSSNYQGYFLLTGGNAGYYAICQEWSGTTCTFWAGLYYQSGLTPSGYTAGPTGTLAGYEGRVYLGEKIDRGFAKSVTTSKSGAKYISPLSTTNTQCNGQGIYFLTDGNPNSSYDPVSVMQKALGSTGSSFSVPTTGTLPNGSEPGHGMPAVGEFAKALRDKTKNPLGLEIKTAVVGFGAVFNVDRTADAAKPEADRIIRTLDYINSRGERTNEQRDYYNCSLITNVNAQNACNWGAKPHPDLPSSVGGYGNGGFYSAQSTDDVVQSVVKFLDDVKPEFESIATGSPTLPQDALNPLRIQPYGYYGSFTPKPQESTQLWVGNMNKYHIFNGELYNASKTIRLIKADGSLDAAAKGLWTDEGMKGQLPLGITTNAANEKIANRTLYTNREITGTAAPYAASEIGSLKKVNVETLFGTGSTALFVNDPDKNYWLNLLGYNVAETGTVTLDDLITKPELRQVGSVMHSTPILLTQSGKISYTSGTIDTTDRDDYLLFGSTQGLLHVVRAGKNATDANRGKEVFAFAPNEMMQNQKNAFLSETSSTLGKNNLFYGIDAPWTAYTQYVAKADGTLTVNDSGRVAQNASGDEIAIKGLQWVYGGLRMGGKSYYALNLSDLDNPELKFHIDPANSKIYKSSSTTTGVTALSYMGQSWSKPTIAYVNFGGEKKLVMFVGGGYDAGYEDAAYDQNTTTGGGAGVYMFDANNGDLLWWASANATAAKGAEAYTNASAATINMKYSVVSQINAIDRDSDGLVDNLYFGDLGGQGFRVDLNNAATGADASAKKGNFAKRVVRLFNEHATGGVSPRFYEMPSVSIHDSDNGYVAAVAFSSGNRSSPLVGTAVVNGNQAGSTTSATDGVFVVYDKDVAKIDLYGTPTLTTPTALSSLNSNMSTGVAITGNSGWKYTYSSTAGAYKGMNELYALDGMLYVNVFHRDGTGIGGACGAGVKGDSYVYQFCLPTGKCPFNTTTSGVPNSVKLGAGILGAGLGQGRSNANNTGLIVNRPNTLNCTTTPNLPECQEFTTTAKLRQLRWYETR